MISFIQMLQLYNTPKVQAPFDISLLHPLLIIQGYNQDYMKDIQTKYYIYILNTFWKHLFILHFVYNNLQKLNTLLELTKA